MQMLRNFSIFLGFFSVLILPFFANAQNFRWAKQIGGNDTDAGSAIANDPSGNIYIAGTFGSTADFDPGAGVSNLISVEYSDAFVAKYDRSGNLIWVRQMGATNQQEAKGLAVDKNGNVTVTGYFIDSIMVDSNTVFRSNGSYDIFVINYNAAGVYQWGYSFGGSGVDQGGTVAVDTFGNVYASGYFQQTADFDPGAATLNFNSNGNDIYVIKFAPNGSFEWAKQIGGNGTDEVKNIKADQHANIYLSGYFSLTCDFNPGAVTNYIASVGNNDAFVMKLNSAGDYVWAKTFGGANFEVTMALDVDLNGNVYSTGAFQLTADFNPGTATYNLTANNTASDIFISKLDSMGDFVWAKQFAARNGYSQGNAISVASNGDLILAGFFVDTLNFDPTASNFSVISTYNSSDVFIARLNSSGDFQWAKTFGAQFTDRCFAMSLDFEDNIFTSGYYFGNVDFNTESGVYLMPASTIDAFLLKIGNCTAVNAVDQINSCGPYTWIDGNTYNVDENNATFTLAEASVDGCDSIVTLNLEVSSIDTVVTQNDITLTASQSAAVYQWVDCNNNNSPINGAVNQSYTATINGNFAVIIDNGSCTYTSPCFSITTLGISASNESISIRIQPNPAQNSFIISSELEIESLNIFDMNGRLIKTIEQPQNAVPIELYDIAEGIYIISIRTDSGIFHQKLHIVK